MSEFPRSNTHIHHLAQLARGSQDESTEWLSDVVKEAWPYAKRIMDLALIEYVEPALASAVPQGLPVPQFTKIDFGEEALQVMRVSVIERNYGSGDICPVLEADILYDGTPHIELSLGSNITFGVQAVRVQGRVEVLLRPLLPRFPLVGAVQVGFVNRPDIKYTLSGLAKVGNQSLIRGLLKDVVDDVLASIAVLPNRIAHKLVPEVDFFNFVAKPLAILRVAVLSGTGFPSTDRHVLKQAMGHSVLPDVYVTLKHGAKTHTTDRVDDNANPVWEEQMFDFVITTESPSQILEIEAYDYDVGSADDFLGGAKLLVKDLVDRGTCQVELINAPEEAMPAIVLAAKWLHVSTELRRVQDALLEQREDSKRPKMCSSLLLSVEIDEAKNLPPGLRPYVRVKLGNTRVQTNAAYDMPGVFSVENPDFEQAFHLTFQGPVSAGLRILYQVADLYTGKQLGNAFSSLGEVIRAGDKGKIYTLALVGADRADATLRVRVRVAAVVDQPTPLWRELARRKESTNS